MTASIAGLGAALPAAYDQRTLWEEYFRGHFAGSRAAERIFAGAGVQRRHSVTDPFAEDVSGWSTGERMRRYAERAPSLGHRAVTDALADAGVGADEIGMLAVASCTGYSTPGLDIQLATSLRLRPDAQRLLVGHMGCHAALPALGAVADFVVARGRPAVLLCLELTSLHLQPATADAQQVVTHALFGDAAVALVLRPDEARAPGLRVVDVAARTDTGSSGHMTWEVTDLGFRMGLSPEVPDVLAEHIGPLVKEVLARHGLDIADVRAWAVHPGGPRILDTVEDGLGLAPPALAASRAVLAEHGNCSSATVLLVLRELLRHGPPPGPLVAVAFGPGLTLYAALLEPTTEPEVR
ncbi:type III polyketide synthase [Amycolatopsis arida]|uniref:type III polyketide synthase n=1 Tax=Amycolatopsis arida TaxID=587909 RepID=UPI000B8708A8|nr:3-oxoacyl-[acyl-carrier-protein] synthase III C-terminal domain-containing protein [Amycolatopsis arida]